MISRRLIRIKILQILYSSTKKSENQSILSVEKELFHSIDKFYDLYLMLYLLLEEISTLENRKIEIRKNSLSKEGRKIAKNELTKNKLIKAISISEQLHELKNSRKLNWKIYKDFINQIYKEFEDIFVGLRINRK